ncbi:hypothetical protein ABK040_005969 [Willaertia magna]
MSNQSSQPLKVIGNYQVVKKLTSGGQGSIFLCQSLKNKTNEYYVLKRIACSSIIQLNRALKEAQNILRLGQHPSLIKCYEFFIFSEPTTYHQKSNDQELLLHDINPETLGNSKENYRWFVCIIFEYCNCGTLYDLIQRQKVASDKCILPPKKIVKYTFQILKALQYINEEHNFIHRDIKTDNIFLTRNENTKEILIKVGDFGFAKELYDQSKANTILGTVTFIAPEMRDSIENDKPSSYNYKIDMWALGCMLVELSTLSRIDFAFLIAKENGNLINIIEKVKMNLQKKIFLNEFTNERDQLVYIDILIGIIENTLKLNPNERMSASELLKKYFYNNNEWNNLQDNLQIEKETCDSLTPTPILINSSNSPFKFFKNNSEFYFNNKDIVNQLLMKILDDNSYILIFTFLDISSVLSCLSVCRKWYDIISQNKYFWKYLYERTFKRAFTKPINNFRTDSVDFIVDTLKRKSKLDKNWKLSKYQQCLFTLHSGDISALQFFTEDNILQNYLLPLYDFRKNTNNVDNVGGNSYILEYDEEHPGKHALVLSGGSDNVVKVYDIYGLGLGKAEQIKKQHVTTFGGHIKGITSIDFKPKISKLLISSSTDGIVCVWDIMTSSLVHKLNKIEPEDNYPIWKTIFLDSKSIACVSNHLTLIDLVSKKKTFRIPLQKHLNENGTTTLMPNYTVCQDTLQKYSKDILITGGGLCGEIIVTDTRLKNNTISVDQLSDSPSIVNRIPTENNFGIYELEWYNNQVIAGLFNGIIEVKDLRKTNESLYSINTGGIGGIKGMKCVGNKLISGTTNGAIISSNLDDGTFLNRYTSTQRNLNEINQLSNLKTLDANEEMMMLGFSSGLISLFDFSNILSEDLFNSISYNEKKKPSSCKTQ